MKKKERITIRIEQEDLETLKNISKENKISIGQIVRNAIKIFLEDFKKF